eukprot:IDg3148t1
MEQKLTFRAFQVHRLNENTEKDVKAIPLQGRHNFCTHTDSSKIVTSIQ